MSHEVGAIMGPKYSDGEIEVGHSVQYTPEGDEVGPRAHIRLRGIGIGGENVLLVLTPQAFAGVIADMMDTAECLGGHYRDAMISKTRFRQRRNN